MRLLASLLLLTAAVVPALSDDVPFAERTPFPSNVQNGLHASSLGELMETAQFRHIKLWYAGQTHNKELALYTLSRMDDAFINAAMLYQNIPVKYIASLTQPMNDIRRAIENRDAAAFAQSYANLTVACNACHQAANVGFISIKKPTSSPFSDQAFDSIEK